MLNGASPFQPVYQRNQSHRLASPSMVFSKHYFGLQGVRLQVAVGVLAGLDFLYVKPDRGKS
jgi:hypothetical protein